ncbi:MAG: hypothetical protein J1E39_02655 [Eubacterium sp.]|nr:hypothetical protein [Eubacterium sp.]
MRKIVLIITAMAAALLLLCSCSDVKSQVQGSWQLDSVGGLSLEEYSEQSGIDVGGLNIVWTLKDDRVTGRIGAVTLFSDAKITYTDNGFRFEDDSIIGGAQVKYDAGYDTLRYTAPVNGKNLEHILKKAA